MSAGPRGEQERCRVAALEAPAPSPGARQLRSARGADKPALGASLTPGSPFPLPPGRAIPALESSAPGSVTLAPGAGHRLPRRARGAAGRGSHSPRSQTTSGS